MQASTPSKLRRTVFYLLAWTVSALFFSSEELTQRLATHDVTPAWRVVAAWIVGMYICAFLSLGVLWMGKHYPIERAKWLRRVLLHAGCSIVFAFLDLALASFELPYIHVLPAGINNYWGAFAFLFVISFHGAILVYWAVLSIQHGLRYYHQFQERQKEALRLQLRAAELNSQLMNAQLRALKGQLQPHFLFNTLNAIMVLIRQGRAPDAEEMLSRLSDLLRCVLEDVEEQEVSLRRELEYVGLYLSIEEVRFQDRLRVQIECEPGLWDAMLPHMALQPIVENAVQHGIGKRLAAGEIAIRARRTAGDHLEITVLDDGPGFVSVSDGETGIGLRNTRARLNQLYGERGELTTTNREGGGAQVVLVLPLVLPSSSSDGKNVFDLPENQRSYRR
jgi:two-component system, LytTR family, sensor kinase